MCAPFQLPSLFAGLLRYIMSLIHCCNHHMFALHRKGDSPGELSGCWNDVLNMKKYIMDVHGFEEDNIVLLMDDGNHTEPTRKNIINAYKKVVSESQEGDAIFLHYSGKFKMRRKFIEKIIQ